MGIKDELVARAESRRMARQIADKLLGVVVDYLDSVPEAMQAHVISMLMTELQVASKKQEDTHD